MFETIRWLFETSIFVTRDRCGQGWSENLKAVYVASNLSIALSYFAIPVMLLTLYRSKRQDLPSPWVLILFASFILLSGLAHLSNVTVFFWAPNRLYTTIFAMTGVVSVVAAATLPGVVRVLVRMPSRDYVHSLNNQLHDKVLEIELINLQIAAERDAIRKELESAREALVPRVWVSETKLALDRIDAISALLKEE